MTSRLLPLLTLTAMALPIGRASADEPTSPATTASTTASSTTSIPAHKIATTNVLNGKVEKISDTSMTIKVTYHTGTGKGPHHSNVGHVTSGWLPYARVGPSSSSNPKVKSHTVTQLLTYQIGEIPPVKVVTDGAHPTRTTGSYADVKVGDLVMIGTGPAHLKNADGTSTTKTQVTGIDVLKHPGAATATTTTTKTGKN
jgi:hypothetical protein